MRDWRFPVAAFVVAAVYIPNIFSAASMPRWWAIAIGLPLVSNLDPRKLPFPIAVCLAAGLMWAAISLLWSPDLQAGALGLLMLVLLCLAMIAAAGEEDLDLTIEAFGWGLSISCALAVPQWLGWSPVAQVAAPAGLFMNSEVLAEVAAPVLVWALLGRRWVLANILMIPLALCHSRIAVLAAFAGLLWAWQPASAWLKGTVIAGMAIAAGSSVTMLGIEKFAGAMDRMVLWGAAVQSITIPGRGLSWWAAAHPGPYEELAHSDLLQMMVEIGIGALPLLVVPIMILSWRSAGKTAERAALAAFCLEGLVSFPVHLPASGFLAAVLAGSLARCRADVRASRLAGGIITDRDIRWSAAHPHRILLGGEANSRDFPV